jgi:hypothetical protein
MTVSNPGKGRLRCPRRREEAAFSWNVTCGMPVYAMLAGVRFDRIFGDADAIIEAYTVGEPKARALFGSDVLYGGPGWAGISYGHVNCLGSTLRFPMDSEVAHTPIFGSLCEGIEALQRRVDWASAGLMPSYLCLWNALKSAFPEEALPLSGFGLEGPITTGWELRGHGFFMDLYDDPVLCRTFLRLVTESIVDYAAFVRSLNGQPRCSGVGIGLVDDVSAMLRPALWPDMVVPFHEQYFAVQTTGSRSAHIENLVPDHLHYLDDLGLDSFDPSVSPRLKPTDIRDRCHVPFGWRLNAMQVRDLTEAEIRRFAFDAAADGASQVFCVIAQTMLGQEQVGKVHCFIHAARQVEELLSGGCPRTELCDHI